MPLTVELPDDVLLRLRATAAARGISVEQLAVETLALVPAEPAPAAGATPAFLAAGASAEGISHRIDALLADGFGRD
jgi:hypothetical protein